MPDPNEAERGGEATIRAVAAGWDRDAPSLVAAACAADDLAESSPLAAEHWLAGEYLVARYLDRLVAARAGRIRRKKRPGGATGLRGLGFVEKRFWNVRTVEVLPLDDDGAAASVPAASVVIECGTSPWPAVLDALHHAFVGRRSVVVRVDERHRALADILQRAIAPCPAIRLEVRPSDEAAPAVRRGVTPVVILPTLYDRDELKHIAEQAVGAVASGAHYGVGGVAVLVVARAWAQRDRFGELVSRAAEDYATASSGGLRWEDGTVSTLAAWRDDERGLLTVELRADRAEAFVQDAVTLCNEALPDSLAATLIAHPLHLDDRALSRRIDEGARRLGYGMVGINVWPSAFRALSDAPFGRHPRRGEGAGAGFTQNAAALTRIEKVVARAALCPPLAPAFVTRPARLAAARELCTHRGAPSVGLVASIAWKTFRA